MKLSRKYIDQKLILLSKSKFRSSFHLSDKERAYVQEKGFIELKKQALFFIESRLAPAYIEKDGRQTPMKNHPVFIAQHATATCCRGCLEKWHGILKGEALNEEAKRYILNVILIWIQKEMQD